MPELPEAERVASSLRDSVMGACVTGWWVGRNDIIREGRDSLDWYLRSTITGVERIGKCVVLRFVRQNHMRSMVIELGMTGLVFFSLPNATYEKHTHLVLYIEGRKESAIRYWNSRRFGRVYFLDGAGLGAYTARRFGDDPLTMTGPRFSSLLKSRRGGIKALLMNQRIIAGLGNIYANEILHRAGIHPFRQADRLSHRTILRLYHMMRRVLNEAIREGGSSVRNFLAPNGLPGGFKRFHRVYERAGEPCISGCGRTIRWVVYGARSSFYCPSCQRR